MANDPIYLFKPVFNFLDSLIRDQGDRLYVMFFYLCLLLIGWILSGGLCGTGLPGTRKARRPSSL